MIMILRACGALFALLLVPLFAAEERACQTDLIHFKSVEEAVHIASKSVAYAGMKGDISTEVSPIPISERLLVQVVFTDGFIEDNAQRRVKWLRCCLTKLEKHLISHTIADVFVWVPEMKWSEPIWFHDFDNVHIMKLNNRTFGLPCEMQDDASWHGRSDYEVEYYLTGRWRLTFSMEFAKQMGYEYVLHLDDDTLLVEPIQYSLLNRAKSDGAKLAMLKDSKGQGLRFVDGLAEFSKDWILKNSFEVHGELLRHFRGNPSEVSHIDPALWDSEYYAGYFAIVSLDFWFEKHVQSFLHAVLKSGKDIKHRWLEQGVLNMMRLIFVKKEEFLVLDDFKYLHTRDIKDHAASCQSG